MEILYALLITLYYYFNVFENCHAIIWRMKQIWFYWQVLVIWNHIIGLHHHLLNPQAFQFYFALLSTASFSYYSIDLSCRFDSSSFIFCSSSFFLFLACSFGPVYLLSIVLYCLVFYLNYSFLLIRFNQDQSNYLLFNFLI